jgi:rod shape determining protein RodA
MTDVGSDLRVVARRRPVEPRRFGGVGPTRGPSRDQSLFRRRVEPAWRHVDLLMPLCAVALTALGVVMILSSTRGTDPDAYDLSFFRRQIVFAAVGLAVMVLMTVIDYRRLREWAWLPYVAVIVALGLVLTALGVERRGTQRWFQLGEFQFQPSELAKVVGILAVAALLDRRDTPLRARWVWAGLALLCVPMALAMLQPDVGTGIVFAVLAMGMLLVAGVRMRHLVVLTAGGVLVVVGILNSDFLQDYQRERLTTFLDQDNLLGSETYNLDQSMIAIGSGGAGGKGLFEGTQTRLGNVPEQHTDFIFAALGEELGFVGSATVLGLFWVLAWRIWRTAQMARDRFGMLLCVGVLSMLVFQVFQNVGMTMGIMPITGIPLPFMSYGGSSIIAAFAAVGLVMNVHMRRFGSVA